MRRFFSRPMLIGPLVAAFSLAGLLSLGSDQAWPGPHQIAGLTEPPAPGLTEPPSSDQTEMTASEQASGAASDLTPPPKPALVTKPTKAYSYARMMRELRQLAAMYPDLIDLSTVGTTVAGRKIPLVTVGTGPREILVLGAEHAREHVTTNFIMHSIDTYAYAAARKDRIGGVNVRKALREVTFFFVPQVNIDGAAIATGKANSKQIRLAKKAVGKRAYQRYRRVWKSNARGVDINRNYPSNWRSNKFPKRPDYQLYKGKRAASEPETRAVIELAKAHNFEYMLTMHTYGQVIYYRDRTGYVSPDALPLAKRARKILGYWLVQPRSSLGRANTGGGASGGWFRQTFRRPALTIELTPSWEPFARAPRDFYNQIWPRGQALFLKLL